MQISSQPSGRTSTDHDVLSLEQPSFGKLVQEGAEDRESSEIKILASIFSHLGTSKGGEGKGKGKGIEGKGGEEKQEREGREGGREGKGRRKGGGRERSWPSWLATPGQVRGGEEEGKGERRIERQEREEGSGKGEDRSGKNYGCVVSGKGAPIAINK
jgi:hypothetical protein